MAAQLPPPVDINIPNIPQQTQVWCWVAVAQQIISASNGGNSPPQCALVAMANNTHPDVCCVQQHPGCITTGSLQQIQGLILQFGGHVSTLAPPANPMVLYNTLSSGRPIIMSVQSSPFSGHVVVLRGMTWVQTPLGVEAVLHINDPMSFFTQPVPFSALVPYWRAAIVVN
jgi:hypothetical protein